MSAEDDCKLFVAGLSEESTEASLRELFESVGCTVIELSLPRDRASGKARGFAFVTLESVEHAVAARQQLDGSQQNGKAITVRSFQGSRGGAPGARPSNAPRSSNAPWSSSAPRSNSGPPRPSGGPPARGGSGAPRGARSDRTDRGEQAGGGDSNKLYVGNLHYGVTNEEVSEAISKGGFQVINVYLPTDADGRGRGFGFVTLKSEQATKAAVEQLNGLTVSGRPMTVGLARRSSPPPPGGASSRPPPRGPRPSESSYPPRRETAPPPLPEFPSTAPPRGGEDERRGNWKDRKKDKKKKNRFSQDAERGRERRRDEEFRGSRRGYSDDWDDD